MTDLRELLILTLALLIVFSLLRAVYVIHRRRKGQIRLSIDKSIIEEAEMTKPEFTELPNGGARIASDQGATVPVSGLAAATDESGADDPLAVGGNVPILLDPVSVEPAAEPPAPEIRKHPRQGKRKKNWREEILGSNGKDQAPSDFDLDLDAVSMTAGERIGGESPKRADASVEAAVDKAEPEAAAPASEQAAQAEQITEAAHVAESDQVLGSEKAPEPETAAARLEEPVETRADVESGPVDAGKIIALNVIAGEDREFNGRELWDFLHAAGLRRDNMKILSKTESNRGGGAPIFRVANIVNPGTFDADAIDEFRTPGISMFMLLPTPINNLLAFEQMLAVARRLANALNGRLLDSERREMTAQAIEQARCRIREFDQSAGAESSSVSNGI